MGLLHLRGRFLFERVAPLEAMKWFEQAKQIDPDFAPRAEELARRAVTIGPSWANCHEVIAWAVLLAGRIDETLEAAERSRSLDPLSEFMLLNFSPLHVYAGREARAIELLLATRKRSPADARMQYCMGRALYSADMLPK